MTSFVSHPNVAQFLSSAEFTFESSFSQPIAASYCEYHNHPFIEVVMHAENKGVVSLQSGQYLQFEPGSFVIHPPVLAHAQRTETPGIDHCILIGCRPSLPAEMAKLLYVAAGRQPWLSADVMALIGASKKDAGLMARAFDHRASALLMQLFDVVDEAETRGDASPGAKLAREADRIILSDYGSISSIAALADRLCVSDSYLRHVFKECNGIGIKQRLIQVRIDRACDLLTGSTLPIKTIAAVCGFDNDRYFSTSFAAAIGYPAGEYRRRWTL